MVADDDGHVDDDFPEIDPNVPISSVGVDNDSAELLDGVDKDFAELLDDNDNDHPLDNDFDDEISRIKESDESPSCIRHAFEEAMTTKVRFAATGEVVALSNRFSSDDSFNSFIQAFDASAASIGISDVRDHKIIEKMRRHIDLTEAAYINKNGDTLSYKLNRTPLVKAILNEHFAKVMQMLEDAVTGRIETMKARCCVAWNNVKKRLVRKRRRSTTHESVRLYVLLKSIQL
jgi:hypothetical protein